MTQCKISLAIAAALALGAAVPGAAATDRISGAQLQPRTELPAAGTTGDRYIVKYGDSSVRGTSDAVKSAALANAVDRSGLSRALPATAHSAARAPVRAEVLRRMGTPGWHAVRTSRPLSASEAASFMRELAADPAVVSVEADRIFRHMGNNMVAAVAPDDPNYDEFQWNFRDGPGGVRAETAWEMSTGEGVVVAVLDTGIVENHLDLQANVIPGYDMISDSRISRRDTDDRVPGGWDVGDWIEANYCTGWATGGSHGAATSSWHGSHVAGTVAQETNNGMGLAGLAHGAQVMPVRVLGSCGGLSSDISDGMLWAAGLEVEGMPLNENPAEVLNMSLGSAGPNTCSPSYQDAIDLVNAAGSIIVVAAGNSNANAGNYTMSSCDGVISVGANRDTGGRASYSNYGERVDLAAPGGDIGMSAGREQAVWQVTNSGEQGPVTGDGAWILRGYDGTSMSSPHVAAGVAMVQSVADTPLDWQEMRTLLRQTARAFPVSIPANTPIGTGILDLTALLQAATQEPCDPEIEDCEPPAPDAIVLVNKVPLSGQSGAADSETLYAIEVPAGVTGPLSISTSGGSGNVSLYVSLDEAPEADSADWSSTRPGNNEAVRINNPAAGTYYIKLVGTAGYTNVIVQARHN